MKVTDDDVGRKIRCPACSYSTAVPPIKVNAKTYHFEYSICDSLNTGSSPGRNAPGMPAAVDAPGESLGGVSFGSGSSPNLKETPEPQEAPPTPAHLLPLRAGAKLAPSPKDPARYLAAIAAARTRTASIRLRPGMQAPPPPPQPFVPQPPAPRPTAAPAQALPEPIAPAPAPKPRPTPPAAAPSVPVAAPITQPALVATGPLAPTPQDALRYQAALSASRTKTQLLRQQLPAQDPPSDLPQPDPQEPAQTIEPLLQSSPDDSQDTPAEPQAQRPERPQAPLPSRNRPSSPLEPDPQPVQERLQAPQRPEAPSAPRPEAPQRRSAVAGTGYVPRPGMPRPIITKAASSESVFTDGPDTTPLPSSGRVDPAAQALAQMAQDQSLPSNPLHPPTPGGTSGPVSSYDPAEALRQLAIAASGSRPDEDADADALTGLARYTTVDSRKSPPKAPAKPAQPPVAAQGPTVPLPADQERYLAALAPSREKTRQAASE